LDPQNPRAYEMRGTAYGVLGFYKEAIADFTESLRLSPEGPTAVKALINRGFAYEQLRQADKALADYNEARRVEPRSAIALEHRGGGYLGQGKFSEALADFN